MDLVGKILIANPTMDDPFFQQTVVLVCSKTESGHFGLILNKSTQHQFSKICDGIFNDIHAIYQGGPVQVDTLHYIHTRSADIEESIQVYDNLYFNGSFEHIAELVNNHALKTEEIRFFVGYSGWDEGQLEDEIHQKAWFVQPLDVELIFTTSPARLWNTVIKNVGSKYKMYANFPSDPRLN